MEIIVPIILQQLPNIVLGAEHLIAYIASVRAARMQSDEWPEDYEAQFLAGLKAHGKDPAYLTDLAAGLQRVNYTPPVTPVVGTRAEPNPPSISK